MRMADLHWLAGLLEGEGWFGISRRKLRLASGELKEYLQPTIAVNMVDEDVIARVGRMFKVTPCFLKNRKCGYWRAMITCGPAFGWMMTLYSLLGKRRRVQIRTAMEQWKSQPSRWRVV